MSRYDAKFLTFALHMRVLMDPLIELAEHTHATQQGKEYKPRKAWRGVDPTQLFPIPEKDREEYGALAKTLVYFLPENIDKPVSSLHTHFEETKDLQFANYDFYAFFKTVNHVNGSMKSGIEMLEKVSRGESLPDYQPLIHFLFQLESRGLHAHHQHSITRGCF